MNYKDILAQEFTKRIKSNPSYSLRAFARDIGLKPASLSLVLNGTRGLSRVRAETIAKNIGFSPAEINYFCDLVTMVHGRSLLIKSEARQRIESYQKKAPAIISADQFQFIADWYHMAIREMVKMPNFKNDYSWIANRLGITEHETQMAWERLCRMGLVFQNHAGEWMADDLVSTPDYAPSEAIRHFHHQIIAKADKSLREDDISERSHTAIMFGINSDQVSEARERIRKFRRELEETLTESRCQSGIKPQDRLYCLSVQFFGLDKR